VKKRFRLPRNLIDPTLYCPEVEPKSVAHFNKFHGRSSGYGCDRIHGSTRHGRCGHA
jgi:hypothetical protein